MQLDRLTAAIGFATVLAAAPVAAGDTLARLAEAARGLSTLGARLVQQRSYPQLGLEDAREEGRLLLARDTEHGTRLRLDIMLPERTIITYQAGEYAVYRPGIRQLTSGRASGGASGDPLVELLTKDAIELRARFEIAEGGQELKLGRETIRLRLTPKSGAAGYAHADVWIDTRLWLPIAEEIAEADRSVTRVELTELVVDLPLEADDPFRLDLPAGVERIAG